MLLYGLPTRNSTPIPSSTQNRNSTQVGADILMRICLDGPKFLSEELLENRHIHRHIQKQYSTQNFSVTFFVVIFNKYVFLSHVP